MQAGIAAATRPPASAPAPCRAAAASRPAGC